MLTLVEAAKLAESVFAKQEIVETYGLEMLIRRVFHRPKVRYVSPVVKALEEEANRIRDLPIQRIKGSAFTYTIGEVL